MDGNTLKAEIRELISDGDLLLAIDRLKTASHAVSPRLYDDLSLIESSYNRRLRERRRGTIGAEAFDVSAAKTTESLLGVLDDLQRKTSEEMPPAPDVPLVGGAPAEATRLPAFSHEKILGLNNLKQISWIEIGLKASRSVGRVILGKGGFGTGFLVGNDMAMTNHHVIGRPEDTAGSFIEFDYQQDAGGGFLPSVRYAFDSSRFYTTGPNLDCTIIGVVTSGNKPPLERWGRLTLNPNADPVPTEHVVVVQHPNGGYKQIVLTANYVVSVQGPILHYTTDTMPGSSGSPVFNDSWHVIAIHRAGGQITKDTSGGFRYVNEGVLMGSIRQVLGGNWPQ